MNTSSFGFTAKMNQESALVYDLRTKLHGKDRYFIIKVPSAKREAFLTVVGNDAGYCLEDFGEILHRGWGEPLEDLKEQLRFEYGLYSDVEG